MYRAGFNNQEKKKERKNSRGHPDRHGQVSGPGILSLSLRLTRVQDLFVVVRIETVISGILGKSLATGPHLQALPTPTLTPFFETGSHYIVLTNRRP